jgi:hypothetical protein
LQHSQAAAISILITTLEIIMAVRVYLTNYKPVVTLRKLRLAFRQQHFMRT